MLELAEEEGLKVFLQVYMDSAPALAGRASIPTRCSCPRTARILARSPRPATASTIPGVRKADLAFYAALAERARRSPAFVGWDLWSEPHVINWATPTYIPNPEFCFCTNTVANFRAWLQKKYGDRRRAQPRLVSQLRLLGRGGARPPEHDPLLHRLHRLEDLHRRQTRRRSARPLRGRQSSVAPDHIVTSHAAGVGLFSSPLSWEGQSDDWTMARQVDYYGTSFYPKHSAIVDRDVPWRGALLDFTRSFGYAARARGFYIGELQGGFGTIALNVSPTVTPEDLRIWTWSALSRGAKGINFYAWYPMSSGYEIGRLRSHPARWHHYRTQPCGRRDRSRGGSQPEAVPRRAARASRGGGGLQSAGPFRRRAAARGRLRRAAGRSGRHRADSLLGVYRALFPPNVPLDYVHINELSERSCAQYKLVFLPYPLMLPEAAAAALTEYVRDGGALVAEARVGWNNERGWASDTIPGLGLHRALNCRETAAQTVRRPGLVWATDEIPGMKSGDRMPGRLFEETLEPVLPSGRVVARFASGAPAAVIGSFGRGKTLTLGSYLSAAYESGPDATLQRFFAGILEWAGVERPSEVTGAEAEVRLLESGAERLVFVFNHQAKPADVTVALRLPEANYKASDLATGQPVTLAAPLKMSGKIPAKDVWVVRLSPR